MSFERLQDPLHAAGRSATRITPPAPSEIVSEPGRELDPRTREQMASSLGHSFMNIRIHADDRSAESAEAIGARAYTVGNHIVFGRGMYNPQGASGLRLLAHELVHAVQQEEVAGKEPSGAEVSTDPAAEAEAKSLASESVSGPVHRPRVRTQKPTIQGDFIDAAGQSLRDNLLRDPRDMNLIGIGFTYVVTSNVATASAIDIPNDWPGYVGAFLVDHPIDGAFPARALLRFPSFYRGGWILNTQPRAGAMTLDHSIFVNGSLSLATYVHELVHVTQYLIAGITGFLTSYFGMSAATIIAGWLAGSTVDPMKSSPHEWHAYYVEGEFVNWFKREYGSDPHSITV